MADSYEINLEIQGGEQPELVMETEGGATDGASARNAEAWAAGTRNGVPVGENDPAYHNNSKYYRDSAAAIAAGDVIDDDAGHGDTMLAWSADKLVGEFGGKAPAIVVSDTTPEPVKTFSDGADGMPMALKVGVEPVQDLHGYDNPWPGGGGKNLLPNVKKVITANAVVIGQETSYATTWEIPLKAGTYTVSAIFDNVSYYLHYRNAANTIAGNSTLNSRPSATFTVPSDDTFAFYVYLSGGVDISKIVSFQLESGSSVTDYAPYSNVCPISGWTGAEVTRTGRNLCKSQENNTIIATVKPGTYTFSLKNSGGNNTGINIKDGSSTGELIANTYGITSVLSMTFAVSKETDLFLNGYNGFATYASDFMLVPGSSPMEYEPYQGNTYQITFPSEAGTVYGGTLTVNADGTGTMVVDSVKETYDENSGLSYVGGSQGYPSYFTKKVSSNYSRIITCNEFAKAFINWDNYNNGIRLVSSYFRVRFTPLFDTLEALNTWIASNNIEVLYELTTPQVYTISAPQVETLKGMNTIFADTGDIKAVEYPADTKLFIEKKISELQALILENISNS